MAHVLESLRKHNKSDLIDLVKMHLSFSIDVSTEEWGRIVEYVEKEEEEREKQPKVFTSTSSSTSTETCKVNSKFAPPKEKELASNIFGSPLSKESLRQAMILVDFLNEEDNYKLEGIFRKSGTKERQQDLRYMLNNGVRVDLKANRFTPVDTSCILKEFVQKLPEPLLTVNHFELHYELAQTIRKETPMDEVEVKNSKRLKIVQLLLHLVPELNRSFFMSLMALLHRVAEAVEVTKMDERSLATIFGAHILCPRKWTPKQIQKNIETITDAMEFLLINYEKLFNGPTELIIDVEKKLNKHLLAKKKRKDFSTHGDHSSHSLSHDTRRLLEDEDDENNTVVAFCERKEPNDTITDQALAELYAQVVAMPDTPHKKKLIKQFNRQNGFGTPMNVTGKHSSGSKWKSFIPPILRPKH